jgi:hypothetical protein
MLWGPPVPTEQEAKGKDFAPAPRPQPKFETYRRKRNG